MVKSAATDNIIPPNSEMNINGYIDREVPYHPCMCIPKNTHKSVISQDLDILPYFVSYKYQNNNNIVKVKISNVTTTTVKPPPKALLCKIQPVVIEEEIPKPIFGENSDDIMNLIKISTTNLTNYQQQQGDNIIKQNRDILSTSDTDVEHNNKVKHKMNLDDDTPFKQRHRRIPPSMFQEERNHLLKINNYNLLELSGARNPLGQVMLYFAERQMENFAFV